MIEKVVLSELLYNESYVRKVLPYLKEEYFLDRAQQSIFSKINDHFTKYNRTPTKKELEIDFSSSKLNENIYNDVVTSLGGLEKNNISSEEWLLENTEKFCQDKALYNAILKSIEIADNKSNDISKGAIPQLLQDALSVSFDTNIGHDYIDSADYRWGYYRKFEKKIPYDLYWFNKITEGGLGEKSLTLYMMPTGMGKSMLMCHQAAANLAAGYNVLYITLEMSEEKIAERIDANLLDIDIKNIKALDQEDFKRRIEKIKNKTTGKLIIKEYPEGTAGAANFRYLINELKLKKNFFPDIIYIDYVGICASNRLKRASSNSYEYGKSVCEELRALSKELGPPVVSAIQTNRSGYGVSDLDLTNTSESIGGPMTADLLLAAVQPTDMVELHQYLFIQLKNRYSDVNNPKKFIIGVDKSKMRFYDVEASAQSNIDGGPIIEQEKTFEGFT